MRRREFIAGLGGAAAWPLAARAQQSLPVIGFLGAGSADTSAYLVAAFLRGLGEGGFVEGQNVLIEYRWAHGQFDRLTALGAELAQLKVAVAVASGSLINAKIVSPSVPMVASFASDPAAAGLVASLNRPGGNLAGVNMFAFALGPKRFELLRQLVPQAKLIAILTNPSQLASGAKEDLENVESAARAVGQKILVLTASTEREFEPSFVAMEQQGVSALLVMADPYFNNRREQIVALAARYWIPAIYEVAAISSEFIGAGSRVANFNRRIEMPHMSVA